MDTKVLDRFTEIDNLLRTQTTEQTQLLTQIRDALLSPEQGAARPEVRITPLDNRYWGPQPHYTAYDVKEFDLSTAREDEPVTVLGDHLSAATDGTLDGVYIRLNQSTNPRIPLRHFNPYFAPTGFNQLYLTHAAQTGKTLFLHVSTGAQAVATPRTAEAIISKPVLSVNQAAFALLVTRRASDGNPIAGRTCAVVPAYTVPANYQLCIGGAVITCSHSCIQKVVMTHTPGIVGDYRYDMKGEIFFTDMSSTILAAAQTLTMYIYNNDTEPRDFSITVVGILEAT